MADLKPLDVSNEELRLRAIEKAIRMIAKELEKLMTEYNDDDLGYLRDDLGEISCRFSRFFKEGYYDGGPNLAAEGLDN